MYHPCLLFIQAYVICIPLPDSLIRLEFNSEECEYYTELDAVEMVGEDPESEYILCMYE